MHTAPQDPGRRRFLQRLAATLAGFLGAGVGVPLVGAAVAPAVRGEDLRWVPLGQQGDFAAGPPRLVSFGIQKTDGYVKSTATRSVWVARVAADQFLIFNARCTHLGCLTSYRADSQNFFCPCHGGVFAGTDGRVLDGPPPRPLDRLEYRIENGQLVVQYRDFLAGVPDQVSL
jgi:menaquinol-cytochrome c reductase iron-sulfur subunit